MTDQTPYAQENLDEFDDLTRFADENFDTNEVDLFQFSGDESSPFTRLKSVILSLEWEITDDYLQDLADEIAELVPDWEDNKAAGVYLQGMNKIGKYLRLRGAYAHPNSIKLLLTFFHHLETIVSSPDMTEERMTALLRSDVRKFKVLQYQIRLAEEAAAAEGDEAAVGAGLNVVARDIGEAEGALRAFKAAILELDWEVSDNSLAKFATALHILGEERIQNKAALILIQGMQALGQYIADERAQAHPESFSLLLSFHDGLIQVLDEGPSAPSPQQKKRILVNKVNRLNHLKKLIAPQDAEVPAAIPLPQTVATQAQPIPESAEAQAIAAQTPPAPSIAELQDDASLRDQAADALLSAEATAPAEAMADEPLLSADEALFAEEAEPIADGLSAGMTEPVAGLSPLAEDFPIELDTGATTPAADEGSIESEIDALFAMGPKRAMLSAEEEYPEEELPSSAYQAVEDELADGFIDGSVGTRSGIVPALADIAEESGFDGSDEQLDPETKTDLDEQLSFFFGDADEGGEQSEPGLSLFDEAPAEGSGVPQPEFAAPAAPVQEDQEEIDLFLESGEEESPAALAAADGGQDEVDEILLAATYNEERGFADGDEDSGFPAPMEEIEESPLFAEPAAAALADRGQTDQDEADALLLHSLDEDEKSAAPEAEDFEFPALVMEDEEKVFAEPEPAALAEEPSGALADVAVPGGDTLLQAGVIEAEGEDVELQHKLDSFFELPNRDMEPTAAEFEKLAVLPEQDPDDDEEEYPDAGQEDFLQRGALADVAAPESKPVREEVDPEIAQLLDSFLDDVDAPPPPAPMAAEAELPLESAFQPAEEPSEELPVAEPVQEQLEEYAAAEAEPPSLTPLAEEGPAELDLFAQEEAPGQSVPEPLAEIAAEELRLERSAASEVGAAGAFEDILDSAEVQDFLLQGREMEEVADEELLFTEEEDSAALSDGIAPSLAETDTTPAPLSEAMASDLLFAEEAYAEPEQAEDLLGGGEFPAPAPVETTLEEAEAPLFVEEAAEDTTLVEPSLFAEEAITASDEALAEPPLFAEEAADAALAETALFAEEAIADSDEALAEAPLFAEEAADTTLAETALFAEEAIGASDTDLIVDESPLAASAVPEADAHTEAMLALGTVLPRLLASRSAESRAEAGQSLQHLRDTVPLSPVQVAAANMLETVIMGLGRHTGAESDNAAVVDHLYQALVYPQSHLPVEAVSAFAQWMQGLLADTRGEKTQEDFTTRDIYRELSGFRARMEEELAQLRNEMRRR